MDGAFGFRGLFHSRLSTVYSNVMSYMYELSMFQVLDVHSHEARQKEYALQGHKHFYFMTLNGSEVCYHPSFFNA